MRWAVVNRNCVDALKRVPDNSVDSIVTDPPYELSNDGKASAARVLLELVFPKNAQIQTDTAGDCQLSGLVSKVFSLGGVGFEPGPSPAVKVTAVALHNDPSSRQNDVEDVREGSVTRPDRNRDPNVETKAPEHVGCFLLELADTAALLDALNRAGCGFLSGRIGVGFRVPSSGLPGFLRGCGVIDNRGSDVGANDDALSARIGALGGTEDSAVPTLHVGGGAVDDLSASSALMLLSVLKSGGAKLVRASTGTRGLPAVLEARRIRVVAPATNRAFTFDLVVHPQTLASSGFMGKEWDGSKIAYSVELWREVLRVLKPGGHLLAFGGTRTYHRMTCAIEDAGFEIRDSLHWMYGTGFPKSKTANSGMPEGQGTALKPGHEPICMARKPLIGTIEKNIAAHGTGGIQIDACRIDSSADPVKATFGGTKGVNAYGHSEKYMSEPSTLGRWPANVLLDEDAAAELDAQSGTLAGRGNKNASMSKGGTRSVAMSGPTTDRSNGPEYTHDNGGGASRFFYVAKPSRKERDLGCDHLTPKTSTETVNRTADSAGVQNPRAGAGRGAGTPIYRCRLCGLNLGGGRAASKCSQDTGVHDPIQIGVGAGARNHHPTVKPIELMRYLVRLVTPPNGLVLDPFTGSGTTGCAAVLEGFKFIGYELEAEYLEIAKSRISACLRGEAANQDDQQKESA